MTARFLRLHVQAWHNHPSLRLDIIGCQGRIICIKHQIVDMELTLSECNQIISEVPFTQLEASSQKNGKNRHTCGAADGHIYSSGGWTPKRSNGEAMM